VPGVPGGRREDSALNQDTPGDPIRIELRPDATRDGARVHRTRVVFFLTALVTLILDIVTKRLIVATLHPHQVKQVFGDWVRLTYIHNPGAAFGLFPESRGVLIAVSIAAVFVVSAVAWNKQRSLSVLPLGLILGGAVGNLFDRIRLGEVVDFVQIGIPPETYWPVFNVADSAVTIGVIWLAVGLVATSRNTREEGPILEEPVARLASPGDEG